MYDQENYRTDDEYSLFDDDNDQDEVQLGYNCVFGELCVNFYA